MFDINLIIGILSLQIGLENLDLNKKQIEGLDSHLNKQDNSLENMLNKILENQKLIINLLKEVIADA